MTPVALLMTFIPIVSGVSLWNGVSLVIVFNVTGLQLHYYITVEVDLDSSHPLSWYLGSSSRGWTDKF